MAGQVRTIEAEIEAKQRQSRASPVTGWPMQSAIPSEQKSPSYGLPEIGWEDGCGGGTA